MKVFKIYERKSMASDPFWDGLCVGVQRKAVGPVFRKVSYTLEGTIEPIVGSHLKKFIIEELINVRQRR